MYEDVILLDAGLGSQIALHITEKVDGDPLWHARFLSTNPDAILKTHLDFLRAGSDYIVTFTYQASVSGFMKYLNCTEEEAVQLIRKAVQLAKDAVEIYKKENPSANPTVIGAIGPYGAALHDGSEYTGDYADKLSAKELTEWHRPRFVELIKAGVKIVGFETIPCQKEGEALLALLSEYPDIKAWFSFSCQDDKSLVHGENFQEVAVELYKQNPEQIIAVGANCLNPMNVHALFEGINKDSNAQIPLIVYPNSGEKYVNEKDSWEGKEHCKPLDTFVEDWLKLGVKYIGSCCRTTSEDTKRIRRKILELRAS